jgi:hypothetical protein
MKVLLHIKIICINVDALKLFVVLHLVAGMFMKVFSNRTTICIMVGVLLFFCFFVVGFIFNESVFAT